MDCHGFNEERYFSASTLWVVILCCNLIHTWVHVQRLSKQKTQQTDDGSNVPNIHRNIQRIEQTENSSNASKIHEFFMLS